MVSLQEFHENKDLKNNVHNYLIEYLEGLAIERVFNKEDTTGIADAREVIDKAFEHLDVLFDSKPEKIVKPEAR